MRGIRMIEARCEARFAQESFDAIRRRRDFATQDFDDGRSSERCLLRAKHFSRSAAPESFDDCELSEAPSDQ